MDDLISRQQAIDGMRKLQRWNVVRGYNKNEGFLYDDVMYLLEKLPSVQPERKGRWIKLDMHAHLADHKCTACGQECYVPTCMGEPMYTYCPNCGADMRGESE